jgi:hypothetical protein
MPQSTEPPIQDVEAIDVVGSRRDGGVDLVIVTSSHLEGSSETQKLLLAKIESYLAQINGHEFEAEFGTPSPERIRIIVNCVDEPSESIRDLVERCREWTTENNASISLVVGGI